MYILNIQSIHERELQMFAVQPGGLVHCSLREGGGVKKKSRHTGSTFPTGGMECSRNSILLQTLKRKLFNFNNVVGTLTTRVKATNNYEEQ